MAYLIKRKPKEIDDLLNSVAAWEEHGGTALAGMSYEQGVGAGIKWLLGDTEEHPIEEEPED